MNDTTLKKVDGDGTELKDVVVDGVASSSSAVEPASGVGGSVSSRSNVETRDEASGTSVPATPVDTGASKLDKFYIKENEFREYPAAISSFYKHQNAMLDTFKQLDRNEPNAAPPAVEDDAKALKISLYTNVVLFILKVFAATATGSLSIIASAVDSALDLLSGSLMWVVNAKMRKRNPMKYPMGKARLEPLGIIVFSALMCSASFQILQESTMRLIAQQSDVTLDNLSIGIMVFTVVVKFCLYLICNVVRTIAQDHRNDVFSNTFGGICAYIGVHYWWPMDSIGGAVIAILIIRTWVETGYGEVMKLTGVRAPHEFYQQIHYVVVHGTPETSKVESIVAFHVGARYFVEVDIVLPDNMTLRESHDIGEALQRRIEQMDNVERAFVHCDYDFTHADTDEHKPL